MAGQDYLKCARCGKPIFHDSNRMLAEALIQRFNNLKAKDAIKLYCPRCVKTLEK